MAQKLVLFVHGLGGRAEATWGKFPGLISADTELSHLRIAHYSFPTGVLSLPFLSKRSSILTLAEGLHTQIKATVTKEEDVVLVCHSLGGLIAKQYIIDRLMQGTDSRVSRVFFYATPHNGSRLADIARYISWRDPQLRNLCKDSDLLRSIAQSWTYVKAGERVLVHYIVAAQDRVVSEESSRGAWGNPSIEVLPNKDHRSSVKPLSSDDLSYSIFRQAMLSKEHGAASVGARPAAMFEEQHRPTPAAGEVRISISSLLRMEKDGCLLLIRNRHRRETFGPVGGVLKVHRAARAALLRMGFRFENIDDDMRDDLRGYIDGENFPNLLAWLETGMDRESAVEGLRREIIEEFAEVDEIAPPELVNASFAHIRTIVEGPEFVPSIDRAQYRVLEIYEVTASAENDALVDRVKQLSENNADLCWYSPREVKRGRAASGHVIGSHAAYLIGDRRFREGDAPLAGQD